MNYFSKRVISKRSLLLTAAQNILLVMIVVYNSHGNGLEDMASLCNVTTLNLWLFFPLGIFLICDIFNDIPAYKIRFVSQKRWLIYESKGAAKLLLLYTVEYFLVISVSTVLYSLTACYHIDFTPELIYGLISYTVSQYSLLLTIYCLMLLLNMIFDLDIHKCGYLLFAAVLLIYVAEITTSSNGAVIPLYHTDLSLAEHLAVLLPRMLAPVGLWLILMSAAKGSKRHLAWYAVRWQNYTKELMKLLGVAALLLSLFLLTAYGGGLSKAALFELIFWPQPSNIAFVSLYTGFAATLCLIPLHYIENADPADCKELVLRINSRKRMKEMMLKEILLMILTEFAGVMLMILAGGIFLSGSDIAMREIAATVLLYVMILYLISIWYYQFASRGGLKYILYAAMILFHINNIYALIPRLSAVHVLKDGSRGQIAWYLGLTVILNAISIAFVLNDKEKSGYD